jgi:threonine dehydrogenase-like Zn-dependent dehydrogenase
METALNALWDSGAGPADRIAIIGGGIVGLLVGVLAAQLPGASVTLLDTDQSRASIAAHLGLGFGPGEDCDIVFHASASGDGLTAAINAAGIEATVIELSWYGDTPVRIALGGAFHSKRLRIQASQVGMVAPARRPRWSFARRLEAAMRLLRDDRLDRLVDQTIDLADAPRLLPAVLQPGALGLAPVIRYPGA